MLTEMQLICSKRTHDDASVEGGHGEARRALDFSVHVLFVHTGEYRQ